VANGRKTGGRKKGVPNKLTMKAREAFQYAFDATGGPKQLAAWAADNYAEFVKLYSKTIPLDLTSNGKELAALTWSFGDRTVKF
jgi:hypothetical protein